MKTAIAILIISIATNYAVSQVDEYKNTEKRYKPEAGNINTAIQSLRIGQAVPVKIVLRNSGLNTSLPCSPQGSRRYIKGCYLIRPSEMSNSQFGSGTVSSVGWSWIALKPQDILTSGSLKVYLQNTSDVVYSKGTSFSAAISGMTKMIDGTILIPPGEGTHNLDVPAGGPGTSSFSFVSGMGVYVAFEYETSGTLAVPLGSPTVSCNDSLSSGMAFNTDQFVPLDAMSTIGFRPETRFGDPSPDDVEILAVYTLGSLPTPFGFPDTLAIKLATTGAQSQNEITVQSQNRQTSQYVIDTTFMASSSLSLITLAMPKLFFPEQDLVIVKAIPGDVDFISEYCHDITADKYNHADPCLPEDGGTGFSGITGTFVAGFNNYSTQIFPIDAVDHCFVNDSLGGLQPYRIVIYLANPNGKPGTLIYNSPLQVSPPGNNYAQQVTHNLNNSVFIPPGAKFFVGYKQLNTVNINSCFQYESPIRPGAFFYTLTDTGTVWTSFDEDSITYKLDIAPRTCKNLKLKVFLEGFYNGTKMVKDEVIVELRDFLSPYPVISVDTSKVDSAGTGYFNFPASNPFADYYFVVKHRNHLETWSHAFPERIDSCNAEYDFTDLSSKAYGNNMVFISKTARMAGGGFALYAGDVNQDGIIDATDAGVIDNDAFNFLSGYVVSDLNGDELVDATDALICDNNVAQVITLMRP